MFNQSTYTFGELKRSIYKLLGEYSVNGSDLSASTGFAADAEKQFISAVNRCIRRVSLSLPLIKKTAELTLASNRDNEAYADLPEDFGKFETGSFYKKKSGILPLIRIRDGKIFCLNANAGDVLVIPYTVNPGTFASDTPEEEPLNLPDLTSDALAYLTAAELCPIDASELYTRLIYKYRDIALNCYNIHTIPEEAGTRSRNRFFRTALKRRGSVWDM